MKLLKDLIAFHWIKPIYNSKIEIPDISFENENSRVGKYLIGEVSAISPNVKDIKVSDRILFHEFSILNPTKMWDKNEIYFIHEKDIPATLDKNFNDIILRLFPQEKEDRLANM
jgi:hypothetical protein